MKNPDPRPEDARTERPSASRRDLLKGGTAALAGAGVLALGARTEGPAAKRATPASGVKAGWLIMNRPRS